jgi:uncharacterized membrane protein
VIEHLQSHPIGLAHVLSALAAIVFGAAVLFTRKGTSRHRWTGRCYVGSMLALNLTALLDYELFGHFGPFHWMALISLATVLAAYRSVRKKAPGWKVSHAYLMAGSYVGLIAAAVAEIASRVPGWSFALSVVISSLAVIVIGLWMMDRLTPRALRQS